MNAPHNTRPDASHLDPFKPERVQDSLAALDLGWSAVAPVQGIEKTTTHPTFEEAMDFVADVRRQAENAEHSLDIHVQRTADDDFTVRLYIGRPITAGVNTADLALAAAIDSPA